MKFVNRGYMLVSPKKAFIDWANENDEDFSDLVDNEASVYLIEEDFYDDEPVVKANFKKVFINELSAVSGDESSFPDINMENFNKYFEVTLGTSVFDAQTGGLQAD